MFTRVQLRVPGTIPAARPGVEIADKNLVCTCLHQLASTDEETGDYYQLAGMFWGGKCAWRSKAGGPKNGHPRSTVHRWW